MIVLSTLFALLGAGPDSLPLGRWRGEVTLEDDTPYGVTWIVTRDEKGKDYLIEMRTFNGPGIFMGGVKLKGNKLTFMWAAGGPRQLFCTLYRDGDGSYNGICEDNVPNDSGQHVCADVTMLPPGLRKPRHD